jgi:hypothetical protein
VLAVLAGCLSAKFLFHRGLQEQEQRHAAEGNGKRAEKGDTSHERSNDCQTVIFRFAHAFTGTQHDIVGDKQKEK